MTPTRIYVRPLLALHRAGLLKAAAHITGGGLPGNLPRVLPAGTRAVLTPAWPVPPVFGWLARAGGIAPEEMLRVFNCGIGMALVVAAAEAETACALLARGGGDGGPARRDRGGGEAAGRARRRCGSTCRRAGRDEATGRGADQRARLQPRRAAGSRARTRLSGRDRAGAVQPSRCGGPCSRRGRRGAGPRDRPPSVWCRPRRARGGDRPGAGRGGDRARLPRRLHAPADAVPGAPLGGADAEHPPEPAAGLPRPAIPTPARSRPG